MRDETTPGGPPEEGAGRAAASGLPTRVWLPLLVLGLLALTLAVSLRA